MRQKQAAGATTFEMISAALSAAAYLCASTSAALAGGIALGDVASYRFRAAPANALAIASLEDLRGKPVLLDFWGRH